MSGPWHELQRASGPQRALGPLRRAWVPEGGPLGPMARRASGPKGPLGAQIMNKVYKQYEISMEYVTSYLFRIFHTYVILVFILWAPIGPLYP